MTTREMLFFCGSVLGPALIAQALVELATDVLRAIPQSSPARPSAAHLEAPAAPPVEDAAERMLRQAFPDGLKL